MPTYQCCFLDENGNIVRIEVLGCGDDRDARREAMTLVAKPGLFSGYELWDEGRKVDVCQYVSKTDPAAVFKR